MLAVLVLAASSGCGPDGPAMVPIRGEVTYDGQPLTEGQVVYLPKDPHRGRQASGPVKPDGTFVMTTQKGGDGVFYGEYDIVVFGYGTDPGSDEMTREAFEASRHGKRQSSIPDKYASAATSGIHDTVDENHSGFKKIELAP